MITLEVLKGVTPKKQRGLITQDLVDTINSWNEDPRLMDSFKENVLSYINVIQDGKYKIQDYVNAVRFVSYKLLGYSDIDAYAITFPDRYQRLLDDGVARADMSPYVAAYTKNKLVVKIFEQTIVPSYVLNAPMHQQALNILADIAINSRSDMARVNACNGILANTKPPEVAKIELDMKIDNKDAIADLRRATEELALQQLQSIKAGQAVKAIAESKIVYDVEAEYE